MLKFSGFADLTSCLEKVPEALRISGPATTLQQQCVENAW
jgi:hypothetical protein